MDARAIYTAGRSTHSGEVGRLDRRAKAIAVGRLAVVALAIAVLCVVVWGKLGLVAWGMLGGLVGLFVILVVVHANVHDAKNRAAAALRFHERGLARLGLDWDHLAQGTERFRSADHPFTSDLDVFGRASLMQLIDATETRFGEDHLAQLLAAEDAAAWPAEVLARQQAVRDISGRPAFREALATAGAILADEKPSASALLGWAEGTGGASALFVFLARTVPALFAVAIAAGVASHVCGGAFGLLLLAELVVMAMVGRGGVAKMLGVVSDQGPSATRWGTMIAAIEAEAFEAPLLVGLRDTLVVTGRRASREIASLERIMSFVDARQNGAFRLFIGPLLMWDANCAIALYRWRARAGAHLREWLDALGRVEALSSLAGFAFENPAYAWPELATEPTFEARSLGHPLISGDRRVGNDVRLAGGGHALVVTGSNMSGKSTLLRAMGVNAVLAKTGAPVCAASMRIGPARVATSMRIADSLESGVSHFYAELRRLKRVLDLAQMPGRAPVLFLLDEILHGTNSRERVIGACAVVRELVSLGALGAVSTHDLGITALERELGSQVENVHFEEHVEGEAMTFDYVLRPGIVQSSNALRLMRAVGIGVATGA